MFFRRESFLFLLCLILAMICFPPINSKPIDTHETCTKNNTCNATSLDHLFRKLKDSPSSNELCKFCDVVVPLLRYFIDKNDTSYFPQLVILFCDVFKIEDKVVCDYVVKTYELSVLTIVRETTLSSKDICSIALNCSKIENPVYNWNITLPKTPKPPVQPLKPPQAGSPTKRILQLSDIHIDFLYQPGSLAACNQPLCCRNSSNYNNSFGDEKSAGFWGDYRNCDVPIWTVENMFDYIAKNENFDFVYWTGDLPPHNVWNQTKSDQLNALERLTGLFQKYFPNKTIYPTLGNHEAAPCNLFPTPNVKVDNITWLYTALAREWTQTGLPSYLSANITQGAFYTIKLFSNLRLISLNTNYCAQLNFWLYINSTDPMGQLDWLAKTLQFAEDNNEKVHIIGHIEPTECLSSWSENYYRIVNRYESTIVGQMFGHTHNDEIRLFYDLENITRATNVAYVTPSVTTFSFLNPGYRIYTVDGFYQNSTWQILDYDTMFLNLTEANKFNKTSWKIEYSTKEAYGMDNLFPQDWSDLLDKMLNDLNGPLADKLYKYFSKTSDNFPNCDDACKKKLICSFKQARSDVSNSC